MIPVPIAGIIGDCSWPHEHGSLQECREGYHLGLTGTHQGDEKPFVRSAARKDNTRPFPMFAPNPWLLGFLLFQVLKASVDRIEGLLELL